MSRFEKGHLAVPGFGRKAGTPNFRKMYEFDFWMRKLLADWSELTPSKRASLCMNIMQLLSSKNSSVPKKQADEKDETDRALEMLERLENKDNRLDTPTIVHDPSSL